MKVSIVTPAYNAGQYIANSIDSALKQSFQDYEMIIVDDGSNDNTKSIIEEYVHRYPEKIKYIYQPNAGPSKARNTAIQKAKGKYIAFLDADDSWMPFHLEKSIAAIESQNNIGLVHSNIMKITSSGQTIGAAERDKRFLSGMIFNELLLRKAHIACSSALVKKSCLDSVGYFDEDSRCGVCEDRDLWLRISKQFNILYIDQVSVNYRITENSLSKNKDRMLQARIYVTEKNLTVQDNLLKKQALASIYKNLGDEYLMEGNFPKASLSYKQSLAFWPLSFWSFINYTKSILKIKPC